MKTLVKSIVLAMSTTVFAASAMANTTAPTAKQVAGQIAQQKIAANSDVQKAVKAKSEAEATAAKKISDQKSKLTAKELKAKKAAEAKAQTAKDFKKAIVG
ncbi:MULTISPECIES: hypothetical protein [Acinetobacter]|uniref:hypothetical protein n=1 Tax=Acinetobacter TaxID=469 RepID=UPI00099270F2|nr:MULTISPECIES: hypothetical protein [Acinetobacter]MCL6244864.1 hypothetical protein [Acinetobacter amyesii]OOV84202.1 hypothetical protein B1201_02980 [Acinetobacter sp. ANC 5600]